jgi:hypothetical protein
MENSQNTTLKLRVNATSQVHCGAAVHTIYEQQKPIENK